MSTLPRSPLLEHLVKTNQVERVQSLLSCFGEWDMMWAVTWAAQHGQEEMIRLLSPWLDTVAMEWIVDDIGVSLVPIFNVRIPKAEGAEWTILMNTDQLKEYLQYGGNPNVTSIDRMTLLHDAVFKAEEGNIQPLKLLLDAGANPNPTDKHGDTPLHITETWDIAKILLMAGADPTIRNDFKEPALQLNE